MSKKILWISIGSIVLIMIVNILIVTSMYGTKTCAYGNCPNEAHLGHNYCRTHKCRNLSCDNMKPYGSDYCYECKQKGSNK